jgi:hypothetical protein
MTDRGEVQKNEKGPIIYQIKIEGHLDNSWQEWFEGMSIRRLKDGNTLLSGEVVDQAGLYGLLKKIRNLGISLISIVPVGEGEMK